MHDRSPASTRRPASAWAPRAVWSALALAALALVLPVRPAAAAEALSLSWDGCRLGSGTGDIAYPCGDLFARHSLVCAFQAASPIDSVIGAVAVVDVQSAAATVPPFWDFTAGGCNDGKLTASAVTSGACADAWGGFGTAVVQEVTLDQPRGLASQLRIKGVATVPSAHVRTFDAGVVYDVLQFDFVGDQLSRCAECTTPACLVLNSITLLRLPGASDILITGPGSAPANFATWDAGAGASCTAVPALSPTWGHVKVLYR